MAEGTSIFLWLIGTWRRRAASRCPAAGFALGLAGALPLARKLNLLALGDEAAEQLGIRVETARRVLLFASALMVGAAVSVSGLIGFVGLIVPHALRLVLGPDHRLLVPASALAGAAFLVVATPSRAACCPAASCRRRDHRAAGGPLPALMRWAAPRADRLSAAQRDSQRPASRSGSAARRAGRRRSRGSAGEVRACSVATAPAR
jgi:hypothetical protein